MRSKRLPADCRLPAHAPSRGVPVHTADRSAAPSERLQRVAILILLERQLAPRRVDRGIARGRASRRRDRRHSLPGLTKRAQRPRRPRQLHRVVGGGRGGRDSLQGPRPPRDAPASAAGEPTREPPRSVGRVRPPASRWRPLPDSSRERTERAAKQRSNLRIAPVHLCSVLATSS